MAADNYWGVWGIWWGVWIATLLLVVAAAWIFVRHWRRDRSRRGNGPISGIAFYLHRSSVMGLYQQDRYSKALEIETEKRTKRAGRGEVSVKVSPVEASGQREKTEEVFEKYIQRAEPITVVGMIMDVLDKRDGIVYVNLVKQELVRNRALVNALGWADGPENTRLRTARLRGIDAYVSMKGLFRRVESDDDGRTVFIAPYGDPPDPMKSPRVRFRCRNSGFRDADEVPEGAFQAQCLGRVEDWDPRSGELIVHPIAIFK